VSLATKSSQFFILVLFAIAVCFLGWELFMSEMEEWQLSVTKSDIQFLQGTYPSERLCNAAKSSMPGEATQCRRTDGPHRILNTLLDVVFPFRD
jgi:Tfp pilus assembly protein PilO